ncbi:hypothetical protein MHM98_11925 [Psychrobium sp. MM17-31]|uniref:hypothetical protein n=1 Tax=Psychrobium sp. MM17-31 TaxID=2917758 RepID=UPI001EF707E8|nr:hypothetical protein [Psychrobium sp. MM17-31]MCG7532044.1 hypothetical protein [Psychrobium sp. MM17-31]
MNTLEIRKIGYQYQIDGVEQEALHYQSEFIVDGIGLSQLYNFEESRPWFGQTEFESTTNHKAELKGLELPNNQLNNGRFVLYRCHCGCDYCGVISCKIIRTETSVKWTDIYFGDEDGRFEGEASDSVLINLTEFEFDINEYDRVIDEFLIK